MKIRKKTVINLESPSGMHMDYTFVPGTSLEKVIETLPDVYDPTDYLVSVIEYAQQTDDPKTFLHHWINGDWDVLKKEWPDFKLQEAQT
mgnify:CR=1 FL=1